MSFCRLRRALNTPMPASGYLIERSQCSIAHLEEVRYTKVFTKILYGIALLNQQSQQCVCYPMFPMYLSLKLNFRECWIAGIPDM